MPFLLFFRHSPVAAPVDVEEPELGDGECGRMLEDGSGLRLLEDGSGLRLLEACVGARSRTGRLPIPTWPQPRRARVPAQPVTVTYGRVPQLVYTESAVGAFVLTGSSVDTWSRLPILTGFSSDEFSTQDTRDAEDLLAVGLALGDDDLIVFALALMDEGSS